MRRVRLTNRLLCPHDRLTLRRKTPHAWVSVFPREISQVTSRRCRAFVALVVVALTAAASLSVASSAGAATPCGKKVLGDWFDNGRIDRLYPYNCYEEAIDAIPPDIGPYSDAEDVITRALQSALDGHLAPGGKDPTPGDGNSGSGNGANGGSGGNGGTGSGDPQAAPEVDTSSPSSVPLPLLVLGGMSVALLAAGGLGYVARRRQAAHADDDVGDDDTLG
jgi:hypothetical protein